MEAATKAEGPHNRSRNQHKRRRVLIGSALALATGGCFLQQVHYVHNYYHGSRRTTTSLMDHGMMATSSRMLSTNTIINSGSSNNTNTNNIKDDIHSSHLTIMPLQDWEEGSLQGLVAAAAAAAANTTIPSDPSLLLTCHPPPHIPPQCCVGTFAGMGRIVPNHMRQQCAHEQAIETLRMLPALVDRALHDGGCDICHILDHLQRNQQNLTFLGDSMTHQTVQGLVCELHRRNYVVEETQLRFHNPAEDRRRRKGRRNKPETVNNDNNRTDPSVMTTTCAGINHCLHLVRTIRVSSPLWHPNISVTIQFFHHYRLPFADPAQRGMVIQAARHGILIVNYGLHWGANYHGRHQEPPHTDDNSYSGVTNPDHPPNPHHLEGALAEFLQDLADNNVDSNHQSRVFLRETSAQHFDAPEGDFSFVKRTGSVKERRQSTTTIARSNLLQRDPWQCVPHHSDSGDVNNNTTIGWRQTVLHRAAHRANYTLHVAGQSPSQPSLRQTTRHVTVLPFADFTKPLYGLHPYEQGGKGGDCTHYCSSPYLYMPLWRSIRLALVEAE